MTAQTLDQIRAALQLAVRDFWIPTASVNAYQKLTEALAALDAEKGAEPVAWELRVDGRWKGCLRHKGLVDQITKGRDVEITPLYASPQQAAPSVADGWQCVPKEPDEEMAKAWMRGVPDASFRVMYRALLAAAPSPPK